MTSPRRSEPIGFMGLGHMGRPMATRLLGAGVPLVAWSRTAANTEAAAAAGAVVAASPDEVFARCRTVLLMLADDGAVDEVLGRGTSAFADRVRDHVLVLMGTTMPAEAVALAADITAAGGTYIEAPVSGSTVPAERGELVAMVAGPSADVDGLTDTLRPMCRRVFVCGETAGAALRMKLAVNSYLVVTVAALAEASHFAAEHGLDLATFTEIVDSGQLASPIAAVKGAKLRDRDFAAQAVIADVRKNSAFVVRAARERRIASPLTDLADALYGETVALGHGADDMAAVVRALEHRTAKTRRGDAEQHPADDDGAAEQFDGVGPLAQQDP